MKFKGGWNNVRVLNSTDNDVKKYVFEKEDAVVESVLYKYPTYKDRTVICCSTEAGCRIGCRFCGAGDYFARSLTTEEIVSQPKQLLEDTGVDPNDMGRLQIMFMSMGEPLMNLKNLIPALRELYALYPKAALLISTSGPKVGFDQVLDVSAEIPTVGLQFSVHESTDEKRNELIPFKHKWTLSEIAEKGETWYYRTGRTPFFNYCVHPENNTQEDADRLAALFNPEIWQATISVVCERDESIAGANARQKQLADDFRDKLLQKGYNTRVFNPAGQDDIGGGCGQLFHTQQWFKNNPDKIQSTCGNGKPVLHMPTLL